MNALYKEGDCTMIIRKEIDLNAPLTDEQKQMLKALKDRPIEFDEDCPELAEEQLSQFRDFSQPLACLTRG